MKEAHFLKISLLFHNRIEFKRFTVYLNPDVLKRAEFIYCFRSNRFTTSVMSATVWI